MKILQVLNHFLPHQIAGTEVYVWALSKQLQQQGIDVQVIIPNYGKSLDSEYIYDGLYVKKFAEPSVVNRSLIMGHRPPDGLNNFISYLDHFKPDIVHFHELAGSNGISLGHVQAAKSAGAKVIMTFHLANYSCKTGTLVQKGDALCDGVIQLSKCSVCYLYTRGYTNVAPYLTFVSSILHELSIDTSKWNSKIGTAFATVPIIARLKNDLATLVAACDRVVTISNWYRRILLKNGVDEDKISFIPQGLPLLKASALFRCQTVLRPLRLLFVGRINQLKGLHLLLEAINTFEPTMVELSIYGNSEDKLYENELRISTAQKSNIFWKGGLQRNDILSTMQAHDVLCLCSTFSEMNPLVIQEAFEAGIPVIASNVYGNSEQIMHEKNGLLFKYNDVKDLQSQIERCINEPSLVNKLSQNIKKPYSFKEVANKYYDLYKTLLS